MINMPKKKFDERQRLGKDDPERRNLLPQAYILSLLNIHGNDTILDVGSEAGYFTLPLARRTTNTVFTVAIERETLECIQKQSYENDIQNITPLQDSITQLSLETNSIDRSLISMALHKVETLKEAFDEMYRVLKPGGRLVVIDWIPEPSDLRANRIDSGDMQRAAERADFSLDVITIPSDKVYAIALNKPK